MKNLSRNKKEGQYMSPQQIVNMILDNVNFQNENVVYKKIMEPSFGDGAFLIEITKRIIEYCRKKNYNDTEIINIINSNIYGIEKDKILYDKAIINLNKLLEKYNLKPMLWNNLICDDTLDCYKRFINFIDIVVGNPPYVRVHNLSDETRNKLKQFQYTNGTYDLYIAFYEIGLLMLKENGILGYISPNSFMKNSSSSIFRNDLLNRKLLSKIFNFKDSNIFKGIDTYTCICVLQKNNLNNIIEYKELNMYNIVLQSNIDYDYFIKYCFEDRWNISTKENMDFIIENKNKTIKIKHLANVQNGISTNCDSVYIGKVYEDSEKQIPYTGKHTDKRKLVYFNEHLVESDILHRCVKASKYNGIMDNTYIIFPYNPTIVLNDTNFNKYIEINYEVINESILKNNYPYTYAYLKSNYDILIKRNMESNVSWYQFARCQGINNSGLEKIIFKHIINNDATSIIPYALENDIIVYSGIFTTFNIEKKFDYFLYHSKELNLIDIYKSPNFIRYLKLTGKDMAGGYVSTSSKNINSYGIDDFPIMK